MSNSAPQLVQTLGNYCNIFRDACLSYGDYVEQLTYFLFLKMADEKARRPTTTAAPHVDEATVLRKALATAMAENAELKKQLAKIKAAEVKAGAAAKTAAIPVIPITVGMSGEGAVAARTLNRWQFDVDSSEAKTGLVVVWTLSTRGQGQAVLGNGPVAHNSFLGDLNNSKPGQPQKIVFRDGVVIRIDR